MAKRPTPMRLRLAGLAIIVLIVALRAIGCIDDPTLTVGIGGAMALAR